MGWEKNILMYTVDNTEAEIERKVRERLSKLEQEFLSNLKAEFITHISHNLRTPLTCIKMAVTMLKKIDDSKEKKRYLDILEQECDKEIEFINAMLRD